MTETHRLGSHISIAGGLDKAVERGTSIGCQTIQIFTKPSNRWDAPPLKEELIESFKSKLGESSINPVVAHDSYLINLASPDSKALTRSREAFLVEMNRCEQLGIPYLVMHPGSHLGEGVDKGLQTIVESFDWLHQQAEDLQMKVLLECTAGQGTNLGFKFEHLARIIDGVKDDHRLGVCLDTCHIFSAGYDISNEEAYNETWKQFDQIIGYDRLKVIHMNDSKKDFGSRVDRHEEIGKGTLGLESFRLLMNDDNIKHVPMILETPKGKDYAEDVENMALLRGLVGF